MLATLGGRCASRRAINSETCGWSAQERRGVVEFVNNQIRGGAHGRGMRLIEQNRHFAEQRARLGQHGDDDCRP